MLLESPRCVVHECVGKYSGKCIGGCKNVASVAKTHKIRKNTQPIASVDIILVIPVACTLMQGDLAPTSSHSCRQEVFR